MVIYKGWRSSGLCFWDHFSSLFYINDLPDGLKSNAKLFADDTSIFSVVNDINESCCDLNSGLSKINNWAYQWKMCFNPDPNKQAAEIIFFS